MSFNNILSTFSLFEEEKKEVRVDTIEGLKVRTYHVLGRAKTHTQQSVLCFCCRLCQNRLRFFCGRKTRKRNVLTRCLWTTTGCVSWCTH